MSVTFETLRAERVEAVGRRFLRQRPWVAAAGALGQIALLRLAGAEARVAGALALTMLACFFGERALLAKRRLTERWLFGSLCATVAGITALAMSTGGSRSPAMPLLFAPVGVAFAVFGAARRSAWVFGAAGVSLAALAVRGRASSFELPGPFAGYITVWTTAVALVLLRLGVAALVDAHARVGAELERARDAAIDEARERARDAEDSSAKLVHEIRNPLVSIKGLVQLFREKAVDAKDTRRLEVILGEIERLEALLADHASRTRPLEAFHPERVEVEPIVDEVLALLDARARRRVVTLEKDVRVRAAFIDRRRVKEALLNLATNAVDAAMLDRAGGHVRVVVREREGGGLLFEVLDDGRGMSKDELAKVALGRHTTRPEGEGLGVLLARGVAHLHGGELSVASEPGVGTRVTLSLPAERAEVAS
ncbi:MAG: HAMP domain-containing sensor histidine kinase [Polyangiaceae bacterium]